MTSRSWKSAGLAAFSLILLGLNAVCCYINDQVVKAQDGVLYTYTYPDGNPTNQDYCGRSLGLPPSQASELHTVVWVAVAVLGLAVVWCVLRLLNKADWRWVLVTGIALVALTALNIMAADATLAAAVPVPDMFGCPNAPMP